MKIQLIADEKTRNIICAFFGKGKTHDFQLYKNSKTHMSEKIETVEDKGFQGLQNSTIPVKASKNHALTKALNPLNSNPLLAYTRQWDKMYDTSSLYR